MPRKLMKSTLGALLALLLRAINPIASHAKRLLAFAQLRAALPALHPTCVVLGSPELNGTKNVRLGRNLYLYRDLYFETQNRGEIRIGDNVVISRGVHIVAFRSVQIGAGTMIGEYTSVRDANHRYGAGVVIRKTFHTAAPISIGRNVWIGRGVTILPGVTIGDNAVIAANAVVNQNVGEAQIVGGVPARCLKKETPVLSMEAA